MKLAGLIVTALLCVTGGLLVRANFIVPSANEVVPTQVVPIIQPTPYLTLQQTTPNIALKQPEPITEAIIDARFAGLLSHVRWLLSDSAKQTTVRRNTTERDDSLIWRQIDALSDDKSEDIKDLSDEFDTRVLTVAGQASITGSLFVTGSTTLANVAADSLQLLSSIPADSTNLLYNTGGQLFWNGSPVGAGAGPWSLNGTDAFRLDGNVGIGTNVPSTGGTAANVNRRYVTIKGDTDAGVLQLTSGGADVVGAVQGVIEWTDANSANANKRSAYISVLTEGTTAQNRGSYMAFGTREDNGSAALERLKITNTGDVVIGAPGATPQARLDIRGATNDAAAVALNVRSFSGTNLLRVRNDGNVGIGTTNPLARLSILASSTSVQNTPNVGSALHITGENQLSTAMTFDAFGDDFFDSPYLTLRKASGNSNAPTPTDNNDILGSLQMFGYANNDFRFAGEITATALENWTSTSRGSAITLSYIGFGTTDARGSRFSNNGLVINGGGIQFSQLTLGAGALTSPSWTTAGRALNAGITTYTDTTGSGLIATRVGSSFGVPTFAASNTVTVTNAANVYIAGAPNAGANTTLTNRHALFVETGNSFFGGNVGIGTTTPRRQLTVSNTANDSAVMAIETPGTGNNQTAQIDIVTLSNANFLGVGNNRGWQIVARGNAFSSAAQQNDLLFYYRDGTNWNEILGMDSVTGNIGIGTLTPSARLTASGTVRFNTITNGTLQADALGNITVSSDERLKDIAGAYEAGLEEILGLEPIRYKWSLGSGFDTEAFYAGFNAQNVRDYLPAAVGENPDGFLTLSDRPILAALVNAVKEMWQRLTGVESRVEQHETELEYLRNRVEQLEAALDVTPQTPVTDVQSENVITPEPVPEEPVQPESPTITEEEPGL